MGGGGGGKKPHEHEEGKEGPRRRITLHRKAKGKPWRDKKNLNGSLVQKKENGRRKNARGTG